MKKWLFGLILLLAIGTLAFRKPLVVYAVKKYFSSHNVEIDLSISKFSFSELELQHILIDNKNEIAKIHFSFSLQKQFFLNNVDIQILKLDVESLTTLSQKLSGEQPNSANTFSYEKIRSNCQKLTQTPLNISITEVILGDHRLKLHFNAKTKDDRLSMLWQDLPKTQGSLSIQCTNDNLQVDAPHFEIDLEKMQFFNMFIQNFSINLSKSYLKWGRHSPVDFLFPGKIITSMNLNKKEYKLQIPHFIFTGQSASQDLKNIDAHLEAKNVEIVADISLKASSIKVASKNIFHESFLSEGNFQVENFSLANNRDKQFVDGLFIKSDFRLTPQSHQLNTKIRDKTKQIFIDDLKILGETEKKTYSISFDRTKTQFRFHLRVLELFPFLKDYLKTLSGKLNIGGTIRVGGGPLHGFLDIFATNISSSTDFGDFEGINIQHRINSFEKFSSPPSQKLSIKKIRIGPGIENVDISYKIENKESLLVHKFSANFDKGLLYSDSFSIDLRQKQIKNFLAQVVDFDLEKVLAIGLKDSVQAVGKLHGHIGLSYKGKKPIFRGLLVSPQNGWIQYRPGDRKQATSLSLSDGPMDILNNYLYDFQYEQLSLRIETDERFDMNMTLNTLGYNPSYLNGKPLKLNINLEQNLLAAMRSLMLTYDLPARIKEKFEKVEP